LIWFSLLQAGIIISGINAEVMPGQWEFQIGPVGALEVSLRFWFGFHIVFHLLLGYFCLYLNGGSLRYGVHNPPPPPTNYLSKQMCTCLEALSSASDQNFQLSSEVTGVVLSRKIFYWGGCTTAITASVELHGYFSTIALRIVHWTPQSHQP